MYIAFRSSASESAKQKHMGKGFSLALREVFPVPFLWVSPAKGVVMIEGYETFQTSVRDFKSTRDF